MTDPFEAWFAALEKRHLETLEFREVRKALQALSSLYVQRRGKLAEGAALETAGKRAAFALFYGPLHFLAVRGIVRGLGLRARPSAVLDLGCGTGAAGAAWALECAPPPRVEGIDTNAWAAGEARWTYARLGLQGDARRGDVRRADLGDGGSKAVVAAYTVNELDEPARDALREKLLERGGPALIVEPIARGAAPWWTEWALAFRKAGGRADEWRLAPDLPERLRLLDRAAGLDHRQLTARSLYLP